MISHNQGDFSDKRIVLMPRLVRNNGSLRHKTGLVAEILLFFQKYISFPYSMRIFSDFYEWHSLLLYRVRSDSTADHKINYSIQSMNQLSGIISLLSTCQQEEISKYSQQESEVNGISLFPRGSSQVSSVQYRAAP